MIKWPNWVHLIVSFILFFLEIQNRADSQNGKEVLESVAKIGISIWTILLNGDDVKHDGSSDLVVKRRNVNLFLANLAHQLPERDTVT